MKLNMRDKNCCNGIEPGYNDGGMFYAFSAVTRYQYGEQAYNDGCIDKGDNPLAVHSSDNCKGRNRNNSANAADNRNGKRKAGSHFSDHWTLSCFNVNLCGRYLRHVSLLVLQRRLHPRVT